jgi:predicted dehydrogenase
LEKAVPVNGKRIGFVDFNLENFHATTFLKAIREPLKARGFSVTGCMATDNANGKAWAAKNNVPVFTSPEALNEQVDCYMILAPSNPEVHLDLCRKVLPFGKITYVDKTFAPDLAGAKEIFELADQHRVKLQTTSALRYTDVQKKVKELGKEHVKHMVAWGGGSSFDEYAIHPVELTISCMGAEATSLMRRGTGAFSQLLVNFSGARTAVINVYTTGDTPFAATITTAAKTQYIPVNGATLFVDTAAGILDFFDAGEPNIDRAESLMIRRILDVAKDPSAMNGFVKL